MLFQVILSGLATGSIYALVALGLVLIYNTTEHVNFAQGEMALISSYLAFMILEQYGLPYHVAFPLALVFSVFLGFFLEFTVLRRAKEPNILGMIVITIGIEMVLLGLVSWKFEHKSPISLHAFHSFCQTAFAAGADCAFIDPMIGNEAVYANGWE